jgi:hypothetical protein
MQNDDAITNSIQSQLNIIMEILEDNKEQLSDNTYLIGMNALCSLHKYKLNSKKFSAMDTTNQWMTYDDICEENELYDEVMELADEIVTELWGDQSSIYSDDTANNLVNRGEEQIIFNLLVNYRPVQGNAGFNTHPMVLHHAIQVIMMRLFKDTTHELEIVRPVSCKCGWRGTRGNLDRHKDNARHQKWVNQEKERKSIQVNDKDHTPSQSLEQNSDVIL